jgi:hypothetical protein
MADPFEIQQERVASDPRRQWGWGPSELASNEEKDAYRVSQGESPRDIRNDPAFRDWAYTEGGYPKSRRQMRMQAEWESRQDEELKRQAALQAMDIQRKQTEIENAQETRAAAKYQSELDEARAQAKIDSEIETQRARFDSGLAELDPRSPDFLDQFAALSRENRLALESSSTQKVASQYLKINEIYRAGEETDAVSAEAKQKEEQAKEESKIVRLSELTKLAKQTGRNLYDLVASNKDTGELIVDPIAVGEAEADLATKPPVDPNLPIYRREASKLREQVRQLDSKILANQVDAKAAKDDRARNEFNQNIAVLTAQRDNLYAEYVGVEELLQEGAGATGEAEIKDTEIPRLTTEDKEAYDALPVGAVFYMNGRKGRKPEVVPQDKTQPAPPAPQTPQPPEDTVKSSQKPFNPKDREELAKLETELQKERERVGLTKQPSGIRQINEAMASQYASVREKAAQLKEAQERLDPFAEGDNREAQDIQRALDVVYPSVAGGGFDIGNTEDPRVVSAAEFLTRVNPSLLRMVASAPASNRSGLSLEEIYDIAKKAKSSARGRPNKK